ncbi:MAG: GNAT family N-acetyltransferase [Bacteroidales bacterium]
MNETLNITHDEKACKFETVVDGITAHVKYKIEDGLFDIRHTIVPKEIGGRNIASKLVETSYKWAESQNLELRATCSYADIWLKRHGYEVPETEDHANGNTCAV